MPRKPPATRTPPKALREVWRSPVQQCDPIPWEILKTVMQRVRSRKPKVPRIIAGDILYKIALQGTRSRQPRLEKLSERGKHLRKLKRQQQKRDRAAVAAGLLKPEDLFLLHPELVRTARVEWPAGSLQDPPQRKPHKQQEPRKRRSA